jgi:hypothetical protein
MVNKEEVDMKVVGAVTMALLASVVSPLAQAAEDDCSVLLQHGLYDRLRQTSDAANAAQSTQAFCNAYNSWKQSNAGGDAGLSIPGIGGLSGTYSQAQAEAVASLACGSSSSSSSASQNYALAVDRISPEGVQAWRECVSLTNAGLKSKTTYRESDQGQLTLEVWYVAPVGAPAQTKIKDIIVTPPRSLDCKGTLAGAATTKASIGTQSVAISCERTFSPTAFDFNGRKVRAGASSVTVMTDTGTLTRHFAPAFIEAPPIPLMLPVGTIIAFSGDTAMIQSVRAAGWWPCDGSLVQDPISPLNGKPTPNLVDRFLNGSKASGGTGGQASVDVAFPVSVVAKAWGPTRDSHPHSLVVQDGETWHEGSEVVSRGTVSGSVQTVPPFYGVIYLIKVK